MEPPVTGNKVHFRQVRGQLPLALSICVCIAAVRYCAAGDQIKQLITGAKAGHSSWIEQLDAGPWGSPG
jgi:hypothetical protein